MDSNSCYEMSLIVVEAIRGRCASSMILTATVSEIVGGQTNSSILVGLQYMFRTIDVHVLKLVCVLIIDFKSTICFFPSMHTKTFHRIIIFS